MSASDLFRTGSGRGQQRVELVEGDEAVSVSDLDRRADDLG